MRSPPARGPSISLLLPSLPARVRVRVLLSVAATSIHVARTRNKLASVRGAETVRVAVYRQPPGVPPRSIWWTDAPTPSTGRPTRFTKFPPTTSSPNFFSLNIFILLSLSFSKCMKIIFERESIFDSSRDRRFLF